MAMMKSLLLLLLIFSMGNAQVKVHEQCPYGWTNFGVRCFKFFSAWVTWITAEKECISHGANLASVHSKAENDFLLSLMPSSSTKSWIGAHDGEEEGQWFWTDGSAYDHTNWCSGEPNDLSTENCAEINFTSYQCWNDARCSYGRNYICALVM